MPKTDARLALIKDWLTRDLGWRSKRIEPASSDASFRRYFRSYRGRETLIVMDAPPDKEDVQPYLKVSRLLASAQVHVPQVRGADVERGLVALEDLGSTQYLTRLQAGGDPEQLYGDALSALANIQVLGLHAAEELPPYDRAPLARELQLMPEWFLERHLGLELSPEERALLTVTFEFLIAEALTQPMVFVHRDYHSRNLMALAQGGPGVIDFQDALRGPIGYDLVSLLKDCYIRWPRERLLRWLRGYRRALLTRGMPVGADDREFVRWFDLIGVQRHLKVLGIFARLWHRDAKPGYLRDLPLTLDYVRDACARYAELGEFARWIEWRIVPALPAANARALRGVPQDRPARVAKRLK
jgi:aminoglycoside/choline kinase family phosphotransferase